MDRLVLVCGSELDREETLTRSLERAGLELAYCADWAECREHVRELAPELVILSPQDRSVREGLGLTTNGGRGESEEHTFTLPATGIRLVEVERSLLQQALERCEGNQSAAARLLGISRYALRYRMEKYQL